jgi:hypothetical protein
MVFTPICIEVLMTTIRFNNWARKDCPFPAPTNVIKAFFDQKREAPFFHFYTLYIFTRHVSFTICWYYWNWVSIWMKSNTSQVTHYVGPSHWLSWCCRFSGICAAIQVEKQLGIKATLFEMSDDVGGTWKHNHYPGCACDIPSHLYSLSFEPNPGKNDCSMNNLVTNTLFSLINRLVPTILTSGWNPWIPPWGGKKVWVVRSNTL